MSDCACTHEDAVECAAFRYGITDERARRDPCDCLCHAGDEEYDDEERDCHWCSGEGWTECDDPIQCTNQHTRGGLCRCSSCGGSGLAKDMTIW